MILSSIDFLLGLVLETRINSEKLNTIINNNNNEFVLMLNMTNSIYYQINLWSIN